MKPCSACSIKARHNKHPQSPTACLPFVPCSRPYGEDVCPTSSYNSSCWLLVVSQKVPFSKKFPEADPLALDLMEKMLQFDPRKRIDVQSALRHPWLAQLHDDAAEPSAVCEY